MHFPNLSVVSLRLLVLTATAASCQPHTSESHDQWPMQSDARSSEIVDTMPRPQGIPNAVDASDLTSTTLDLSKYAEFNNSKPLFVPHNGMLFLPVDGKSKVVTELRPDTVFYLATKASCAIEMESTFLEFLNREANRAAIPSNAPGRTLAEISIDIPRQVTPPGHFVAGSHGICFGWRDADGWHWSLKERLQEKGRSDVWSRVQIITKLPNADALALIFADGTFVDSINYQTLP